MQRKLTKKLANNLQHHLQEDEEAMIGGRGSHHSPRRQSTPPQQRHHQTDAEDELEDEEHPQALPSKSRERVYESTNPFTLYDRDRVEQPATRTGAPESTRNSSNPRLGASILRAPSQPQLANQKQQQQQQQWAAEDEEDEEEYETENNEDEEEEFEASLRFVGQQQRRDQSKKKQASSKPKKVSSQQKSSTKGKIKPNQVLRKGSQHGMGSEGRRSARGSGSSLNGNSGYSNGSSSRLPRSGSGGGSNGREIMPLPIEIPETVTDADAFRRYLTVRRGAVGPTHQAPLPHFEDHRSDSVLESTGGGSTYGSIQQFKNLSHGHAAAAASLLVQRRSMALSLSIMTLALLSASASQLRFVVAYSNAHSYPALNYFLICSCIFVEILVGVGFVIISRFDFTEKTLDKTNTYLIFGLFYVAIANVIIASFALDDHVCEVQAVLAAKKNEREQYDMLDQSQPHHPLA